MDRFKYRIQLAVLCTSLAVFLVAGCGPHTSSDELNGSMNAKQKAIIKDHKQKQGD